MLQVIGFADQIQGLLLDIAEPHNLIIIRVFQQAVDVDFSPDPKSHNRNGMFAHFALPPL